MCRSESPGPRKGPLKRPPVSASLPGTVLGKGCYLHSFPDLLPECLECQKEYLYLYRVGLYTKKWLGRLRLFSPSLCSGAIAELSEPAGLRFPDAASVANSVALISWEAQVSRLSSRTHLPTCGPGKAICRVMRAPRCLAAPA